MKPIRIAVVLLLISSFSAGPLNSPGPPTAHAQTQERRLEARLLDLSMWVGPQDTLTADISVRNLGSEPAGDLQVAIVIYQGVATRSHLERSFDGRLGEVVFGDTVAVEGVVDPRSSTTIRFSKALSEIGFFRSADDRVYPLTLTVKSGRLSAPPIQTHMIFFTKVAPVPLSIALVIAPNPDPIYNASGQVTEAGVSRLIGDGSALETLVSSIEAHPEARITLAPSGLLLDSLADLANGYVLATGARKTRRVAGDSEPSVRAQHFLERLRAISTRDSISVAASTYSHSSLPWLNSEGFAERIRGQFDQTRLVLEQTVGMSPLPDWALPGDGVADDQTIAELSRAEVTSLILAPESIRGPAKRQLTLAAPVRMGGKQSPITALIYDGKVSTRVTPTQSVGVVQTRQRFLAETATIMLERPAQRRVIAVVPPRDWIPHAKLLGDLLTAAASSPWMQGVGLDVALTDVPATETVNAISSEAALNRLPSRPPDDYASGLRAATRAINDYVDLHPPESRVTRLSRMLAISESSIWWDSKRETSRGLDYAETVVKDVRREFSKIHAPRPQTITLTSRTGVIPLVVTNSADYPVQVIVRLESENLEFSTGNVIRQLLAPPAQTFDVTAKTTSSGTFPLRVVVETPGRAIQIDATNLTVRSTAYNLVAVAITAGAAIFLISWWLISTARRRISA